MGVTPVPIPNTMVKTQAADGTALVTVWESRWPPNPKKKNRIVVRYRYRHRSATTYRRQPSQQGSAVRILENTKFVRDLTKYSACVARKSLKDRL